MLNLVCKPTISCMHSCYEANQALTKASYELVCHGLYLSNVLSCVIMNSRLGASMTSGFYVLQFHL